MLVVIVGGGAGGGAVQHLSSLLFTIDLTDNSSVQISGGRTTSGKGSSEKNNVTLLVQGDFQAAKQPITTFITGSFLFGIEIGGFH